jgi:hypothetical protein
MIRLTPWKNAFLAGFALLGSAGIAAAQQPTQSQINAVKQSCRSDYQANCSGVPTGGSAALQCLQGHVANLSSSCQTAVHATMGGGAGSGAARPPAQASQSTPPAGPPPTMSPRDEAMLMRRSCGGDFRAYCEGVRLGGGHALACLVENQSRLSPPCRNALAEARGAR